MSQLVGVELSLYSLFMYLGEIKDFQCIKRATATFQKLPNSV